RHGQVEEGVVLIRQGLTALNSMGAELFTRAHFLALLAEAYGKMEQIEEGLNALTEALAVIDKTGERYYEAELHRLRGELTLQSTVPSPKSQVERAEECFQNAIEVAHRQQAKSLELRAAVSLSRLWKKQGKAKEAHKLLAEIYNWFTEGFDTADL